VHESKYEVRLLDIFSESAENRVIRPQLAGKGRVEASDVEHLGGDRAVGLRNVERQGDGISIFVGTGPLPFIFRRADHE
jgi:hypothetical protein